MTGLRPWLLATRPKTLAAGVVPVAVGAALAYTVAPINWLALAGCAAGALLIQIGCNFANDAFDALKGADTAARVGPQRAVASGLISARAMLIASAVVLLVAFVLGLYLATLGGWPVLVLGMISILCAVGYTAGPLPLAYVGLGDLFVFLFFGWFAVLGTAWVLIAPSHLGIGLPLMWWQVASMVGFQATAIIAVNNLRDRATDAVVGKRTLAVRLGDHSSRWYYAVLHLCAASAATLAAVIGHEPWLGGVAALALIGGAVLSLGVARTDGAALNGYLARSAALELVCGIATVAALTL